MTLVFSFSLIDLKFTHSINHTDFKKELKGLIVIVITDLLIFTNGANRNQ